MLVSSLCLTGCGGSKTEKIEGSAGLVYELSEDGTYYIFTDGKSCTDENIVIGNWHEENGKGLPVKAIGDWPFSLSDEGGSVPAKSVTVSDGITEYAEGTLGAMSYVPEDITIYFRGSEEEWNNVEIAERGNSVLNNCKIVFDYKD